MPFYTYFCENCGVDWEKFNKINDRDLPITEPCPNCASVDTVTRPVEVPGMVSGIAGITHHMPSDFRQIMQRVKKANFGSTIPDV